MRLSVIAVLAIALIACWFATRLFYQANEKRREIEEANQQSVPDWQPPDPQEAARQVTESDEYQAAGFRILFIGNSHTTYHDMPRLVMQLLNSQSDDLAQAFCYGYGGASFLEYHLTNPTTLALIQQGDWDYVVLQSQKYSTSGRYNYPYDSAVKLASIARENGAKVIMYPEWARLDHPEEGQRILELHQKIAKEAKAQVAPVPVAWRIALEDDPHLRLHAIDGNHSSPLGAYLTACVFFAVLTGEDPSQLPVVEGIPIEPDAQRLLRTVAWSAFNPKNESGD